MNDMNDMNDTTESIGPWIDLIHDGTGWYFRSRQVPEIEEVSYRYPTRDLAMRAYWREQLLWFPVTEPAPTPPAPQDTRPVAGHYYLLRIEVVRVTTFDHGNDAEDTTRQYLSGIALPDGQTAVDLATRLRGKAERWTAKEKREIT